MHLVTSFFLPYRWIALLILGLALLPLSAQKFPDGFSQVTVATGLAKPTALVFAPDGRIFVAEQAGKLRVVKQGQLLAQAALSLNVNSRGERGLIGIALDPNFGSNGYVYLYYTLADGSRNRVSRFTMNGDVLSPSSELVLRDLDPLSNASNHNGGDMNFRDGKLFIAVGDNATPRFAQDLDTYHGKILRINPNGSVPAGNPFTSGSLQKRSLWSWGLRNPFTFDIEAGTGRIYLNEVGQRSWEEINDATAAGRNFGWPATEGRHTNPSYANPVYAYGHASGDDAGCAITGGTFFSPATTTYPAKYHGTYFYQDYCNNWINYLDRDGNRQPFATALPGAGLGIQTGPDGSLYYLNRSGALRRIIYTDNTAPQITEQPSSVTVPAGQPARFTVGATGAAPLRYQWQKDGSDLADGQSASLDIATTDAVDAGTYRVVVTNDAGSVVSQGAILTVTAFNTPPVASITAPAGGSKYRAGQAISFAGTATDEEDGTLPAAAFEWVIDFHHDDHRHDGPPVASGTKSGTFVPPTNNETSANVWYRIYLIVTDSEGLRDTTYHDIYPHKSTITLTTQPAGLQLTLDGQPRSTPLGVESVEGIERTLGVVSDQTVDGLTYTFDRWQQGGPATQTIVTPQDDQTYTAIFKATDGSLPSPWATTDIGAVGKPGAASFADGVFTVNGSGKDIWGNADGFRYVYQSLKGDGEITAHVFGPTDTNPWAKAGLMMRSSLAADARHASIFMTPERGVAFQWRELPGGGGRHKGLDRNSPERLRLVRKGNEFIGYHLLDGTTWVEVGRATIPMDEEVYVGLALTSHNNGALARADFEEVDIQRPQSTFPLTLEAEQAILVGARTASNHTGYTGSGFVDYLKPNDDYIEWQVRVPTAGDYRLSFRYALGGGNRPLTLSVNGATVMNSLGFPATGAWTNWGSTDATVSLSAGSNTVRLTANGKSGPNMDHLRVEPADAAQAAMADKASSTPAAVTTWDIYPNPATESVRLSYATEEASEIDVFLVDAASGRVVQQLTASSQAGNNELTLDVASLPTGVYAVRVLFGEQAFVRRLLIRR